MAATFGDFIRAGRAELGAAANAPEPAAEKVPAAAQGLYRLVAAMSRCAEDLVPYGDIDAVVRRPDLDSWMRAAVDVREALRLATGSLRPINGHGTRRIGDLPGMLTRHLAAATMSLTVGRDLLHTHFSASAWGELQRRSDWSDVITSEPVTSALLEELADWARRLAPLTARLSFDPAVAPATRESLDDAARWLWTTGAAVRTAQEVSPVPSSGHPLLHAVPAYVVPARRPPREPEPVTELCEGISIGALRLRLAACGAAEDATWSHAVTAAGWRSVAAAAAAAGHASGLVLDALIKRVVDSEAGPQLRAAAAAVETAWSAWRRAAAAWGVMTTETSGLDSPKVADTSDLLLRMGRLAWNNPHWTPGRGQSAPLRDPADLAPNSAGIGGVTAAVHHTWAALADTAAADLGAVRGAVRAGRLYVPTRSLPEEYDVPRRFGPALPAQLDKLEDAYRAAAYASAQAAMALGAVAVAVGAPSSILAAARSAATRQHGPGWRHHQDPRGPAGQQARAVVGPGPVEQAVRQLGPVDATVVLRAAAIDRAARNLVAEARASKQNGLPTAGAPAGTWPSAAGAAARVAAKDYPSGPPGWLAGTQTDSSQPQLQSGQPPRPRSLRPADVHAQRHRRGK